MSVQSQRLAAELAQAGGQLVGTVITSSISNKTQKEHNRNRIEILKEDSRLNFLSKKEKLALDNKVANAKNDLDRLKIYEDAFTKLGVASIQYSSSIYAEKLKADAAAKTRVYYFLGALGILAIAGIFYLKKKNIF